VQKGGGSAHTNYGIDDSNVWENATFTKIA